MLVFVLFFYYYFIYLIILFLKNKSSEMQVPAYCYEVLSLSSKETGLTPVSIKSKSKPIISVAKQEIMQTN